MIAAAVADAAITFDQTRCKVFDVEVSPGRWLVGFYSRGPGGEFYRVVDTPDELDHTLNTIEESKETLVGYNCSSYDIPMLRAILAGRDAYKSSQELIHSNRFKLPDWVDSAPQVNVDHIDLWHG